MLAGLHSCHVQVLRSSRFGNINGSFDSRVFRAAIEAGWPDQECAPRLPSIAVLVCGVASTSPSPPQSSGRGERGVVRPVEELLRDWQWRFPIVRDNISRHSQTVKVTQCQKGRTFMCPFGTLKFSTRVTREYYRRYLRRAMFLARRNGQL